MLSVGILWFQSMVPHQICALGIQTPHTPLPYTYLGHMHRVGLSSYSTPSRGYRRQASPFCGAVWTSITLTNNERERLYDQVGFCLVRVTVRLGEMPSPPTCVCVCWGGGLLRATCNLRGVGEVRLICKHTCHIESVNGT